jgi:hypothetical protein
MHSPGHEAPGVMAWPKLSKTDLVFFRLGGDGLGNLLFTWARCLAACHVNGWPMVWPAWPSFKPKNWRVNPYDKRLYAGLFRPAPDYVSGPGKLREVALRKWFSEAETGEARAHGRALVVFRGRGRLFADFLEHQPLVRQGLLRITRARHLAGYRDTSGAPVRVHVRRGDFESRQTLEEISGRHNVALPIQWYVAALQAVRAACGQTVPAQVCSDGTEEELRPLLRLPGVQRVSYGSSVADLWALSRARVLITSGSTFSMWASYLGQAPTIWYPGKMLQRLRLENRQREFEWRDGMPMPGWLGEALAGPGRTDGAGPAGSGADKAS